MTHLQGEFKYSRVEEEEEQEEKEEEEEEDGKIQRRWSACSQYPPCLAQYRRGHGAEGLR
jgi:hypothetical protein